MSKVAQIAVWPGAKTRDLVAQQTRYLICDKWGFVPFWHQADVWAAADGLELSGKREKASTLLQCWRDEGNVSDIEPRSGYPACLKFGDGSLYWLLQDDQKRIYYEKLIPRLQGIARVLALLASYKAGKSAGIALYTSSFGLVDGFICEFIGLQYDTSEPEFLYVRDFLLRERGLNLKSSRYAMKPGTGDMEIVIADSQACFRSASFKEAQSLEGKERDMYVFTESYQTGGLRPYDELSQNLGARDGIALFPSTRKRPNVEVLHKHGHSSSPEFDHFHCTCNIDRSENPYAHDARARAAAKLTMTRERYAVAWEGKPGTYLGSVYEYTLGEREIPICEWMPEAKLTSLVIPETWVRWCGIDFGSHYAALFCGFDPRARVRALAEVANYHYVSGEIEFLKSMSLDVWARQVLDTAELLKGRWRFFGDANLQMRRELRNTYGIHIEVGMPDLELRCDITRTFFQHDRILIAPWLDILPEEIERAKFPPHGTNSMGYYRRVKGDDHMLDCLEHPCGKRGQGKVVPKEAPASPLRELIGNARLKDPRDCWDPHLGA